MSEAVKVTNYNSAIGRLGSAIIIPALMIFIAILFKLPQLVIFALKNGSFTWHLGLAIVLGLLSMAVFIVPLLGLVFWIRLDDDTIQVRKLFKVKHYTWDEVAHFEWGKARGAFSGYEFRLRMKNKKKFMVKVSRKEESLLAAILQRKERTIETRDAQKGALEYLADGIPDDPLDFK